MVRSGSTEVGMCVWGGAPSGDCKGAFGDDDDLRYGFITRRKLLTGLGSAVTVRCSFSVDSIIGGGIAGGHVEADVGAGAGDEEQTAVAAAAGGTWTVTVGTGGASSVVNDFFLLRKKDDGFFCRTWVAWCESLDGGFDRDWESNEDGEGWPGLEKRFVLELVLFSLPLLLLLREESFPPPPSPNTRRKNPCFSLTGGV